MNTDALKATLRQIGTELEDLWIEKEVYRNTILAFGFANPDVLQKTVEQQLLDPATREQTRQRFAAMWKSLDEAVKSIWNEDLPKGPPPSGKPN